MTFSTTQLRKEARPLALPWIMIMLVGSLSLIRFSHSGYFRTWNPLDWILPLGCFLAIPLLAVMPLGTEFQNGTLTALLAQPIDRKKLWLQKTAISVAAVLPAAVLYLCSFSRSHEFDNDFWLAAVWMVAATAGAVAGTLLAKSAIGGLALSSAFFGTLFVFWSKLAESNRESGDLSRAFLSITIVVLCFYALVMVWLGRRMFLRFQSTEGIHGANDLLEANHFLPRIVRDWLRSKPHGAFLNLLRREFHLLRAVWLLALLSFVTWILLILFQIVRPNTSEFNRTPVPAGLAVILSLLIAVLAGSLSLGEEKNWGTHAWHLTMPMAPSVQWAIKLVFALCVSILCAVAIPLGVLMARGWISGSPRLYLGETSLWLYPIAAALLTLLAFWSACAVKGTVHAVVGFFALLFALAFAIPFSPWLTMEIAFSSPSFFNAFVAKLDPVSVHHVVSVLMETRRESTFSFGFWGEDTFAITIILLVGVGLMQSRRMYKTPGELTKGYIARRIVSLFAACFLPSVILASFYGFAFAAYRQEEVICVETHKAIETIQLSRTSEELARPQRLTIHDLESATPFSEPTRRWISRSRMVVISKTISADERQPRIQWPYESALIIKLQPGSRVAPYAATIVTASGHTCNLRFWAEASKSQGILFESCQ